MFDFFGIEQTSLTGEGAGEDRQIFVERKRE